jgi:hypothetical protein
MSKWSREGEEAQTRKQKRNPGKQEGKEKNTESGKKMRRRKVRI